MRITTKPTIPALESLDLQVLFTVVGGCGKKGKGCCQQSQQQQVIMMPPPAAAPAPLAAPAPPLPQTDVSTNVSVRYQ